MNPDAAIETEGHHQTAKSAAGMTTKVVKGTAWTLAGLVVPIVVSLFATPVVTRLLGAEAYGVFVLVLLIPTYFSFADLGMNLASTKFGSEAFAEGAPEREARVVRTAGLIAVVTSLPLAAAMIIFSRGIVAIFNVPEHLVAEAAFALKLAGVIFVVNFLNNIFNTPELTRLRMDLNTSITSGVRVAGIVLTPVVIYLGGGISGAVAVALCVSLATLVGHIIVSARLLPELFGLSLERDAVRPMLKFGLSLMVAFIAVALLANLEKFVLARVASVETLAYYSIAATFAALLTVFSGSMAQSLMPAFSQLQREHDRAALTALYSRGIRVTLIGLVPAVVLMVLSGRPFFTYWFSEDFGRESTVPFYIIAAGFLFTVVAYFPYTVVMAAGRSDVFAKIYWMELVPYLILVWLLAARFGAVGAAVAWSLRAALDAVLLFVLAGKVAHIAFAPRKLPQFAAALAIMLVPLAALAFFPNVSVPVIATTAAALAAYSVFAAVFLLEPEEIDWLKGRARLYLTR
ncbi:MAG: flippase [Pyrinomonadaceae bacterium]